MYCPNCSGQNSDDAKFCRVCGSDLSLIVQAMTGKLSSAKTDSIRKRRDRDAEAQPSHKLQKSIVSGFMGLGFVAVGLSLMMYREWWGVFMFIPGFMFIGQGVSAFAALKMSQSEFGNSVQTARPINQSPRTGDLAPKPNSPGYRDGYGQGLPGPPPSVTEGTTKIIDPAAQRSRETN